MIAEIVSDIIQFPSTLHKDRVLLHFRARTDDETISVVYAAKLDPLGNRPQLQTGQRVNLEDAILNIHPNGNFYFASRCRLAD